MDIYSDETIMQSPATPKLVRYRAGNRKGNRRDTYKYITRKYELMKYTADNPEWEAGWLWENRMAYKLDSMNDNIQRVTNTALNRLTARLSQDANLGETFGESRQSINMIAETASDLKNAVNGLREGNPLKVARNLRVNPRRVRSIMAENARKLPSAWLKLAFGWAPLVNDIRDGFKVITDFTPVTQKIKASSRRSWSYDADEGVTEFYYKVHEQYDAGVALYVTLVLENPNIALANQLGLLNVPKVGWELVPFSFVVDYFYNVSGFLGNLTRFAGYTVKDSGTSVRRSLSMSMKYHSYGIPVDHCQSEGFEFTRDLGLPAYIPQLNTDLFDIFGGKFIRASTSVALLVQALINIRS